MNRRSFLQSILAAGVAPYVAHAESLMRIRPSGIYAPDTFETISMDPAECAALESVEFEMVRDAPFRVGDIITISGINGFADRTAQVRRVTTEYGLGKQVRAYVSATIPNALVFDQPLAKVTAEEITWFSQSLHFN